MQFEIKLLLIVVITVLLLPFSSHANEIVLDKRIANLLDNREFRSEIQMVEVLNQLDSFDRNYLLDQAMILFASNQEEYQNSWLLSWVFGMYACSKEDILDATKPYVHSVDEELRKFVKMLRTEEQLEEIMEESRKIQKEFETQIKVSISSKKFQGRLIRCLAQQQ